MSLDVLVSSGRSSLRSHWHKYWCRLTLLIFTQPKSTVSKSSNSKLQHDHQCSSRHLMQWTQHMQKQTNKRNKQCSWRKIMIYVSMKFFWCCNTCRENATKIMIIWRSVPLSQDSLIIHLLNLFRLLETWDWSLLLEAAENGDKMEAKASSANL